jgi:hypothetical protein
MPRSIRSVGTLMLATAMLATISVGTAAATSEVCSPTPKTSSSFCVSYGLSVTGTTARGPFDASISLQNTSTGFPGDTTTWVKQATVGLVTVGSSLPIATPSVDLPDNLLLAGGDGDCATGNAFATCDAGYGSAAVNISGGIPFVSGAHTAYFGIEKVTNVADTTGSDIHYRAQVRLCIDLLSVSCYVNQSETVELTGTATGGTPVTQVSLPLSDSFPVNIAYCGCSLTVDYSLGALTLALNGSADHLGDGTPAGQTYDVLRLPAQCGPAAATGTFTSDEVSPRSVQVQQDFTVDGCPTAAASVQNVAGLIANLTGGASTTPVVGRTIADWYWDYGHGVADHSATPFESHTFSGKRTSYKVGVTVTDSAGAMSAPVKVTIAGSRLTAGGSHTSLKDAVSGTLSPLLARQAISVTLQRLVSGHYSKVGKTSVKTNASSVYKATFPRVAAGTCRAIVSYAGTSTRVGAKAKSAAFAC